MYRFGTHQGMRLTAVRVWVHTQGMTVNPFRHIGFGEAVAREVKMLIAGTKGASVKSIAEATDIRRATLSNRLNGHSTFNIDELGAVARALGTTAAAILTRAEQALADLEPAEPAPPAPAPSVPAPTPVDVLTPSRRSARAHGLPTAS